MFLFIDQSILKVIDQPSAQAALTNIANARKYGKHIVVGKQSTIKALSEAPNLYQARSVYRKIYNDLPSEYRKIRQSINWLIEIVAEDILESRKEESRNVTVIRACFKYFEDYEILSRTKLLLEDIDDAFLYEEISKYYRKVKGLKPCRIGYSLIHGGGQNTSKAFGCIQDDMQSFCLCILDSDRKSLNTEIGSTAKAVEKVSDQNKPFCNYLIIDVRDIENLLPNYVYEKCFGKDKNKIKAIEFFKKIESCADLSNYRKHMDIKKGLTIEKILSCRENSAFRIYWTEFFYKAFEQKIIDINYDCWDKKTCIKPNVCQCYVTEHLGEKITVSVKESYKEYDMCEDLSELPEILKVEWLKLGRSITSWCCSSNPMRA